MMNEMPRTNAALPASRSSSLKRSGKSLLASAKASGGVMPATIAAAIGPYTWEAIRPVAKV